MGLVRRHTQEFVGGLAAVLSITAFFVALPWPEWLIGALGTVIVLLVYLLWQIAPPKIDPGDQERLDDLLQVLNRRAEEQIHAQDFYATWNGRIMNPVKVFVLERGGIEHHFLDRHIEPKRAVLFDAAAEFLSQEAKHGFPPQGWGSTAERVPGFSPSESEGARDREQTVEIHRGAIFPPAQAFLKAHAELVEAARARGYRVDALSRERHPEVREWDRLQEKAEERVRERRSAKGGLS